MRHPRQIQGSIMPNDSNYPDAQTIEEAFATYNVSVCVSDGQCLPHAMRYRFAVLEAGKLATVQSLTDQVALALGVRSLRLTRPQGYLSLELTPAESRWISFAEVVAQIEPSPWLHSIISNPGTVILGRDSQNVPLLLRISAQDIQNCLIVGLPGSGKTELTRTMVTSLLKYHRPRDVQTGLFISPSSRETFVSFNPSPYLIFAMVTQPVEIMTRLKYLVSELAKRKRDQITRPLIVVVMDELDALRATCGEDFEDLVCQLVQHGYRSGISVIGCMQEPTDPLRPGQLHSVFTTRIVGRITHASDAFAANQLAETGAERLLGAGDFLLMTKSRPIRFQAARAFPSDITNVKTTYPNATRSNVT